MTRTVYTDADGLGVASWVPIVASIAGSIGAAVATKYIVGGSPSQKEVEKQMRLQQQLEIQRMVQQQAVQSQQTQEVGSYLLPALGVVALVMLLR